MSHLTVVKLRAFLKKKGIKPEPSARKARLVELYEEAVVETILVKEAVVVEVKESPTSPPVLEEFVVEVFAEAGRVDDTKIEENPIPTPKTPDVFECLPLKKKKKSPVSDSLEDFVLTHPLVDILRVSCRDSNVEDWMYEDFLSRGVRLIRVSDGDGAEDLVV